MLGYSIRTWERCARKNYHAYSTILFSEAHPYTKTLSRSERFREMEAFPIWVTHCAGSTATGKRKWPQPFRGDDRGPQSGMQFGPLRSTFPGRTLNHSRANNLALAELTVLDTLVGRNAGANDQKSPQLFDGRGQVAHDPPRAVVAALMIRDLLFCAKGLLLVVRRFYAANPAVFPMKRIRRLNSKTFEELTVRDTLSN
jgi:hypothetical protein